MAAGARRFDKEAEINQIKLGGGTKGGGKALHLQLLHLASPAAAFLAVDAADDQRQDLLLQLRIRVDLKKKSRSKV